MTLIGVRCKNSNVFSQDVLIIHANHPNADLHSICVCTLWGRRSALLSGRLGSRRLRASETPLKAQTQISFLIYNQKKSKSERLFDVGASFGRVPPLPIPNREVKASLSHDTCLRAGKVGCADIKVPLIKKGGRCALSAAAIFIFGEPMSRMLR